MSEQEPSQSLIENIKSVGSEYPIATEAELKSHMLTYPGYSHTFQAVYLISLCGHVLAGNVEMEQEVTTWDQFLNAKQDALGRIAGSVHDNCRALDDQQSKQRAYWERQALRMRCLIAVSVLKEPPTEIGNDFRIGMLAVIQGRTIPKCVDSVVDWVTNPNRQWLVAMSQHNCSIANVCGGMIEYLHLAGGEYDAQA